MTDYTYNLSDFAAVVGNVDAMVLKETIAVDIPAQVLSRSFFIDDSTAGDPRYVFSFVGTLSGAEVTTLDGIVAAHLGPYAMTWRNSAFWHLYLWNTTASTKVYLPWHDENESGSITSDSVRYWLPGPFRLLHLRSWSINTAMDSTTFGLHINNDTTAQASKTVNMAAIDTPYDMDFRREDNLTVENQPVALSCDPGTDPSGDVYLFALWGRATSPW